MHLHELIFQHFDPSDVLISSETNRRWFDAIGESRKCMSQINLGLDNWWQTETREIMESTMKIISNTSRRYQNVTFNAHDDEIVSRQALQLMKFLAPSLVDLRFFNADHITVDEIFKFPHLERLQFINNVSQIDELLLQGSTQLKELNLKHHYWAEPEPVRSCLKENKQLIILKLWDTGISKLFETYEPSNFNFKLKHFATGADGEINEKTETNFLHFLGTQDGHIEAIRFRSGLNGVSGTIISRVFEMSALRKIHLDGIGDVSNMKLKTNHRITELRLDWKIDNLEKLSPFLEAVPKAETLFLRKVNKDVLEHVAIHMKELKTLYFTKADCCMGCFKKFLSSNEETNKDIRLIPKEWY